MRSDLSLIYAARFGDGRAFGELVDRYGDLLFRFALRFARDAQAAEELAHDTLVDFYHNLSRYEPRSALGTYLCGILSKKALCKRRSQKRRPEALGEEAVQSGHPTPIEQILQDEELMRLKHSLDGLDEPLRIVVELRYIEGLRLREVADVLAIPLGTVKSRIHTALRLLRGVMDLGGQ